MIRLRLSPTLLLAALPLLALADIPEQQRARIDRLENAVLAPCCYQEPVATHRSEIALKMRAEITEWVIQGKSDRQILDAYKKRYGAQILVEPEGALWWWVHIVPGLALLLGAALTVRLLLRWRARPGPAPAQGNPPGTELPAVHKD
jgi:cytochrome c-type biogenesis protein CcmH/NrfF